MLNNSTAAMQFHYLAKYPDPIRALLTHAVIFTSVLIATYIYFKKQYGLKSAVGVLPGIKTPFYSMYGIFGELPSYKSMKKLSLPPTAYVQQMFSGLAVLFPGEKAISTRIGLQTLILLTKAESVEEFLCSNVLITKPFRELMLPFFGRGLFLSAGPRWKCRRKVVTPMFHYDILKEFVPIFDKEAKVLVDILRGKHHEPWIDVVEPLALCSMDIICKTFLGLDVGAQKESDSKFVSAMGRVTQTMIERIINPLYRVEMIFNVSALGRQFKQDISYLRETAFQAVKQRKEERKLRKQRQEKDRRNKSDVMDLILDFQKKHPDTTENDIRDELLSFIFAGEDTTASGLSWALYLIGLYRDIQSKIQEELDGIFGSDPDREITAEDLKQMDYLDCVLKESQRLYPSVPSNGKYALEDCTLSDYKIRKGSIVIVDTYDLHRNPDIFPNPEVFDPERFRPENCTGRSPYAYVPFSGGVRSCVGRRFAVMEAKTVVANVLHKFSLKSLEPRDKIHTSVEIILRSPRPLKVKFIPRNSSV